MENDGHAFYWSIIEVSWKSRQLSSVRQAFLSMALRLTMKALQMTTLPAEYLHPLLKKCEDEGITHIVLEASSLGLSSNRLDHCDIDLGILLNIGTDHYEEHGGKSAYINAKKRLIRMVKTIIVNRDDEQCVQMAEKSSLFH